MIPILCLLVLLSELVKFILVVLSVHFLLHLLTLLEASSAHSHDWFRLAIGALPSLRHLFRRMQNWQVFFDGAGLTEHKVADPTVMTPLKKAEVFLTLVTSLGFVVWNPVSFVVENPCSRSSCIFLPLTTFPKNTCLSGFSFPTVKNLTLVLYEAYFIIRLNLRGAIWVLGAKSSRNRLIILILI